MASGVGGTGGGGGGARSHAVLLWPGLHLRLPVIQGCNRCSRGAAATHRQHPPELATPVMTEPSTFFACIREENKQRTLRAAPFGLSAASSYSISAVQRQQAGLRLLWTGAGESTSRKLKKRRTRYQKSRMAVRLRAAGSVICTGKRASGIALGCMQAREH